MAYDLTGQTVAEKFKLIGLVKSGPEGDLYRAENTLIEKPVTLLVLPADADAKARESFRKNAKTASAAEHPNMLNVLDFGIDGSGISYAVCDAANPETLGQAIARGGKMPVENAVEIGKQIAAALETLHASGRTHGNLTADNILLSEVAESAAIAKVAGIGSLGPLERTGDVLAAAPSELAYLAPELCSGTDSPDALSDIYSAGVVIYEMMAGTVPFSGEKPTDVLLKHIEEPPPPLSAFRSDLPPTLEPVILKALSKSPEMRQQSGAELMGELSAAFGDSPAAVVQEPAKKNNFWATAAMVLIGTAALGGALIYATWSPKTDPATALQPDANGLPVQPINPATGTEEQQLAVMPAYSLDGNSNMSLSAPDTMPGGDGYNPWATGVPPPGAPSYVPPGGEMYNIDPRTGSPFMPPDGGVILVPVPANVNTQPTGSPSPGRNANVNTNTRPTTPANTANTAPAATPRPAASPRNTPPPTRTPAPSRDDGPSGDEPGR
ncbi:MAG: serine/threonine protein kinase [Acidobacteria bacterium]|nr:serine/threonine protein kinase [Acidobacteriota bacterium]